MDRMTSDTRVAGVMFGLLLVVVLVLVLIVPVLVLWLDWFDMMY